MIGKVACSLVVPVFALVGPATAQGSCGNIDPWLYFSHDTFGYGVGSPQGPSRPRQTMKALTEGLAKSSIAEMARVSYFTVRMNGTGSYSPAPINYDTAITVNYQYHNNGVDVVAVENVDFTSYFITCGGTPVLGGSGTFEVPVCPPATGCAGAGQPFITFALADTQWEQPELVRMNMTHAMPTTAKPTTVANFAAGWVIQDECESGALFKYPEPLPAQGSQVGLTVQLATTLTGYSPSYGKIKFADHLVQNYPYAASEVVAESSHLDFAIALLDENAASRDQIGGNLVPAPADLVVTLEFRDRQDWDPKGDCINPPGTWSHYSVPSVDFLLQERSSPTAPWTNVPIDPITWQAVVTIPANSTLREMRFVALDELDPNELMEVAHLSIVDAEMPLPPPPFDPAVWIGWSSDFRFVVQEVSRCPL